MPTEMVFVVFNSSIEDEMLEALREAGMDCFTKIPGLHGQGSCSEPRLDSHVWPGTNIAYLIAVQSEERERILEAIRKMKGIHREEGVSAFVFPLTHIV